MQKTPSIIIGLDRRDVPVELPLIGAGTWLYNDTIAYQSVCKSLEAGYTFIDTAFGYGNQKGVGMAIRDCYHGAREDLFVMTKVPGGLSASQVHAAHVQNLLLLGLDYVDHLMTHFPSDWNGEIASKGHRQEEWVALEDIYKGGEARSIGISHYCQGHIMDILEIASVMPSINQVEYHIGSQDIDDVIDMCVENEITFMSFSPLCGPCQYQEEDSLIHGNLVQEIASHYEGVSGNQVALRFIVQQGIPVIPKSNTLHHIQSNLDIFHFQLSDEHMERLRSASTPPAQAGDCQIS